MPRRPRPAARQRDCSSSSRSVPRARRGASSLPAWAAAAALWGALPRAAAAGAKHAFELGPDVIDNPMEESLMLMGVLAVSVLIEKITEVVEHGDILSQESMVIVHRVYKEIMILGVISFFLVVIILQLQPAGFSIPLFEFCHFLLFFMGIFFCCGMTYTVRWTMGRRKHWERAEKMEHDIHAWRHQGHEQELIFARLQGSWSVRGPGKKPKKKGKADGKRVDIRVDVDTVIHSGGEISRLTSRGGRVMHGSKKLVWASTERIRWCTEELWIRVGPPPAAGREMLDMQQQQQLKLALAFRRDKEVSLKLKWFQKHVLISELEACQAKAHLKGLRDVGAPLSPRSTGPAAAARLDEVRRAITVDPGSASVLDFVHARVGHWQGDDERKVAALALAARIDRLQAEIRERETFERARRKREVPVRYRRKRRSRRMARRGSDDGLIGGSGRNSPASSIAPSARAAALLEGASDIGEGNRFSEATGFSKDVHSHRYHPLEAGRQYEEIAFTWELMLTLLELHILTPPPAEQVAEESVEEGATDDEDSDSLDDGSSSGCSEDSVHLVPANNLYSGREPVEREVLSADAGSLAARPNFGGERLRKLHVDAEHFEHAKVPFSLYRSRTLHKTLHEFLELRWQTWFMLLCGTAVHLLRMEVWESKPPFRDGADSWVFGVGGGLLCAAALLRLKIQTMFASYYCCMMQHEELTRAKRWLGLEVHEKREGNLSHFFFPVRICARAFLRHLERKQLDVDAGARPDLAAVTERKARNAFTLLWPFTWDLIALQFISVAVCLHLAATILTYSPRLHELYCGIRTSSSDDDDSGCGTAAPSAPAPVAPSKELCPLGWLWSLLVNTAALVPYLITFLLLIPGCLAALSDLTNLGANLDMDVLNELEQKQERVWRDKLDKDRAEAVAARIKRRLEADPAVEVSPYRQIDGRHNTDMWTGHLELGGGRRRGGRKSPQPSALAFRPPSPDQAFSEQRCSPLPSARDRPAEQEVDPAAGREAHAGEMGPLDGLGCPFPTPADTPPDAGLAPEGGRLMRPLALRPSGTPRVHIAEPEAGSPLSQTMPAGGEMRIVD
eukprot:TRINITY_DN2460_c0_g1_i1.p1 TRINITY_DN2460_c0_g1~~TRINITY_DN2460_c0_g1_i1.p1  ORF type:complete len:1098 (+),score=351.97 TRINITY_DN2460_c0_g1_i1:70-3294(+)